MNQATKSIINNLETNFKNRIIFYLNALEKNNVKYTLTSGRRSYARQAEGHRKDPASWASPDTSYHVKGRAIDIVFHSNETIARTIAASLGFHVLYHKIKKHHHIDNRHDKQVTKSVKTVSKPSKGQEIEVLAALGILGLVLFLAS